MERNNELLIAIINKADEMDQEVSLFFAAKVGRTNNPNEEFALLVQWSDAIDDALSAALSMRSWPTVDRLDKMRDECNMWLDHWHECVAP